MAYKKYLQNILLGSTAAIMVGARLVPGTDEPGPVVSAAVALVKGDTSKADVAPERATVSASSSVLSALDAFRSVVGPLSHPRALEDAFKSYFAYKSAHPNDVKKPYLYFVDYGLPNTTARGYVFDMDSFKIVDGPFHVAAGRGSRENGRGVPTLFSNSSGSAATSLGLFVAQELYEFGGHSAGQSYSSVGMRLMGVSAGFNDNARARGVVAHGAPYVTPGKAGRSEGCPAMEQARAKRLLPKLANGSLVFLFAPDPSWMQKDPWVSAN
jgi:hypothetical protein